MLEKIYEDTNPSDICNVERDIYRSNKILNDVVMRGIVDELPLPVGTKNLRETVRGRIFDSNVVFFIGRPAQSDYALRYFSHTANLW